MNFVMTTTNLPFMGQFICQYTNNNSHWVIFDENQAEYICTAKEKYVSDIKKRI